jgi:hypothetical protein
VDSNADWGQDIKNLKIYVGRETFRWLRERQPMAKIGYSIYLYDLRRGAGK